MALPDIFEFQRAIWAQASDFSYFSTDPDEAPPFQFETDSDTDRPSSPVPLWNAREWDAGTKGGSHIDTDLDGWRDPSSQEDLDGWRAPSETYLDSPKIVVTLTVPLRKKRGTKFRGRRTSQYKILSRSHSTNPIKINKYLGSEQSNPL